MMYGNRFWNPFILIKSGAAVLLIGLILIAPVDVYAQGGVSVTTSSGISTTANITDPVTSPAPSETALQEVEDHELYGDMLEHFKSVTETSFELVTAVVALLGAIGVVAAYYSFRTVTNLETIVRKAESDLHSLKSEFIELKKTAEADLTKGREELDRMEREFDGAIETLNLTQKRLWWTIELRDKSSTVRVRAVQQLSEVDDIICTSSLIDVLEKDEDVTVQMQAVSGLGRRLKNDGSLGEILGRALEWLHAKFQDGNADLKVTILESYEEMVSRGIVLPQSDIVMLREAARDEKAPEVAAYAQKVLDAISRRRNQDDANRKGDSLRSAD